MEGAHEVNYLVCTASATSGITHIYVDDGKRQTMCGLTARGESFPVSYSAEEILALITCKRCERVLTESMGADLVYS